MYEEELLYLRSRGMAPPALGIHPYLGGGLPANITEHLRLPPFPGKKEKKKRKKSDLSSIENMITKVQ